MFPFIFQYGDFKVSTFGFMLMVASLAATFYAYWRAPKKGLSQVVVLDLGIIGTLAGIVGSRLFHTIVEKPDYYWHADWEHLKRIFQIWNGGFVSYGAIILIGVSWFVYLKIRKLEWLKYLDLCALIFPIVIFSVRLGCLGAGCCYGKPTDFFIHFVFHSGEAGNHLPGIARHATQGYAMFNALLLFVVLHWIDRIKKFDGQVVWSFLMAYGFLRFLEELTRGDTDRGVYAFHLGSYSLAISTGQIMSLIAMTLGASLYFYFKWRAGRQVNFAKASLT